MHFGRPKGAAESRACCRDLVVTLFALRHFATGEADPVEDLFGKAEPLIHTGHDFDYLADQVALLVLYDFGDKIRPDSLAIFVKRELSVRSVEHRIFQFFATFLIAVPEIAFHRVARNK